MREHDLTFRVVADCSTAVRDLGNGLMSAIRSAQKRGLHPNVHVEGPTILCPGCVEPCGQCAP